MPSLMNFPARQRPRANRPRLGKRYGNFAELVIVATNRGDESRSQSIPDEVISNPRTVPSPLAALHLYGFSPSILTSHTEQISTHMIVRAPQMPHLGDSPAPILAVMSKPVSKSFKPVAALPADYAPLLADIKVRVQAARIKVGLAANQELLSLYWDIGRLILDRQRQEGWGAKVIDRLSVDLQNEFPGQQGFSPRNLKYMRAFAEAWPETPIARQPVALLAEDKKSKLAIVQAPLARVSASISPIVQAPLAQLSWYHHLALIDKLNGPTEPSGMRGRRWSTVGHEMCWHFRSRRGCTPGRGRQSQTSRQHCPQRSPILLKASPRTRLRLSGAARRRQRASG